MERKLKAAAFALIVCLLIAAPAALASAPRPVTNIVPLHVPNSVAVQTSQTAVFAPDGRLWVAVPAGVSGGLTTLIEVAMPSGRVLLSRRLSSGVAALIVGPDDNIWFAGRSAGAGVSVGYVSEGGKVRSFRLHRCCVDGLAAGPDGAVWLTLDDSDPTLVRISTAGGVTSWNESKNIIGWEAGLIDGANGTLWTSVLHPPSDVGFVGLAQIGAGGRVQLYNIGFDPAALDATGHLRGWYTVGEMLGLGSGGQLSPFPLPPTARGFNFQGSTVLGADRRVWFTGSTQTDPDPTYYTPVPSPPVYSNPVIGAGSISTPGSAQTWPSPFTTIDGAGVGNLIPNDNGLLPGPDGRLYALGYQKNDLKQKHPHWHLFAVTLPTRPNIKPATVRVRHATRSGQTVNVELTCTGQSGRFCAGTIYAIDGAKDVVRRAAYALRPGLQATHSLTLPAGAAATTVDVTSYDSLTKSTQERIVPLSG